MKRFHKQNEEKSTKKKLKISELFYNNHFVMIFSLVTALIMWFVMAMNNTTERPRQIVDVPVEIMLSPAAQEDNLKVFEQSNTTATVSVSGNSIAVNRLKPSDMKAVATLYPPISDNAAGGMREYTLALDPRKVNNELSDYQMVSVDPQFVTVLVDKYKEISVPIEIKINYGRDDAYYYNNPSLSEDSVTISGPESSVEKVKRIVAEYKTDKVLTATETVTCKLIPYDEHGQKIEDPYLECNIKEVGVTISVFPIEEMNLKVSGINMPSTFSFSRISTKPSRITVAGPEDALKNLDSISIEPIDFSTVNLNNTTFDRTVSLPTGFLNIRNIWDIEVSLNLKGYSQKTLSLHSKNVVIKNDMPNQKSKVLTENLMVQVVGPTGQIEKLASENMYATVDMSTQTKGEGTLNIPVTISFNDAPGCWAYGKYGVSVQVEER